MKSIGEISIATTCQGVISGILVMLRSDIGQPQEA